MSPGTAFLLVLLGLAVGWFGTLVGAGGGFILTPVLLLAYPHDTSAAVTAVSLAVVWANATSGSIAYARQGRIDWRSGRWFALATLPGALAGALLVGNAPRRLFDVLAALCLGALALWLFSGRRRRSLRSGGGGERVIVDRGGTEYRYHPQVARGTAYSVGVGFVSSFLGIGGGVIHVPILVRGLGFPVHIATATSHFVLAVMALVATFTHVIAGDFTATTALRTVVLCVGVTAGAQGGAWMSQRMHGDVIQRLLALAMLGLAVRLLLGAL